MVLSLLYLVLPGTKKRLTDDMRSVYDVLNGLKRKAKGLFGENVYSFDS